jgi:cell division transport system ATP-binding protein
VIGKAKHVIDQRVPEILEYVGLGDKLNHPDELSGGEQQRVSIAGPGEPSARAAGRQPTGNLDPNMSVALRSRTEQDRDDRGDGHARPGDRRCVRKRDRA